jgi:P4 family phage/plasmid primase-like protien
MQGSGAPSGQEAPAPVTASPSLSEELGFAQKVGELLNVPLVACPPNPVGEFYFPTGDRDSLTADDNANQLLTWQPGWAIMARTGGSVAVVDVDPRNGGDIAKTRQQLDGLKVRIFAEIATPSGGRHFYIAGHPELPSCAKLDDWPGIDVLSFGKLVFLLGTRRPKYQGRGYETVFDNLEALADGGDPDGAETFADWVAERRAAKSEQFSSSSPWRGGEPDGREAKYLAAMLKGIHADLAAMGKESGRNTAVYNAGLKCGNFIAGAGLSEQVATEVLLDASNHNGLVAEDGQQSVLASIRSGIKNGKNRPRAVPPSTSIQVPPVTVLEDGPPPADSAGAPRGKGYSQTDDGNALRLIDDHGRDFRRVADMRKWFVWDGCRWALDHEDRSIRGAARDLARQLPSGGDDSAARRFKRISMSATGISGCVRVAETDTRISILAAQLDAHRELLNTPSGVVDLRTGTPRPHDPSLLLTRITAYPVDLEGSHPQWDAFLAETFQKDGKPDVEMISYIQRLAGLALCGFVSEHILPFFWGKGRNGKTVLALVLQGLLGEADTDGYAVSAPDGFLMTGRDGKHETEIARLRGTRLVVCSEQTSGKRFDEAKVKKFTGGDILTGRFMRGDFFDFYPSHLLLVLSNERPEVREGGPAFWRRVRLIPFNHVVPDEQQIPNFADHLLQLEGPAMLGWAVRGAVDVLANGLADPPAVVAATEEYRISEDTVASFVRDECLPLAPAHWCWIPDFRARYERHCAEMGAEPVSGKALTMRLERDYGVTSGKGTKGRRVYRGIALTADEEDQP